ncbi:MAG: cobalt-precorrin-5B (C(1))-methyltransferase [Rhodospirillaceae bacterium]|nr:cobalt-precorrin-5B (C(1))-methyltransferase [Rhodospirillales bacterium]
MTKELRKGWTTGACATAAAKAAFVALHGGGFPDPVIIRLPQGLTPAFALAQAERIGATATAGIIKDAGDDPDVTHGALVLASVQVGAPGTGVTFRAGLGIGTITLPGLPLPPGEPAINPGPRAQITANLTEAAAELGVAADVVVTISIPGGEALAEKTLNGRLGIKGGLSILGTTGVVLPYSCAAWVHSIHRGIDVARALGLTHLAATTGKTSEALARRDLHLPDQALIDMGDMAGAVLKYLRSYPVPRLTLVGGFAKLAKLAAGEMDLHSRASQVDVAFLSGLLAESGAAAETITAARDCGSAGQVLALAGGVPLGDLVARRAREAAMAVLAGGTEVDVIAIDRAGHVVGRSG